MSSCVVAECERSDWIIGVAGTCNNVTGLCDCPEGFTGRDVWASFESCHIPIDLATTLNRAYVVADGVTSIIIFCILVYVFIKWQFYSDFVARLRSTVDRSQSFGQVSRSGQDGRTESTVQVGRSPMPFVSKRRQRIFVALVMMFLYPVFSLPYAVMNALNPPIYRYDLPWIGDITLAISICFLYAGYWVVLYIYYKSLPDLRLIGKLMNLKSVFIERPQLLRRMTVVHVVLLTILTMLSVGILPSVLNDQPDARFTFSLVYLYMSIVFIIEYVVIFCIVCLLILKLYKEARELAIAQDRNVLDLRKLNRAITNIKVMLIALPIVASFGVAPFCFLVTDIGKRYFFVWFLVASGSGYTAAILGSVVFARELLSPNESTSRDIRRKPSEKKTIIHDI